MKTTRMMGFAFAWVLLPLTVAADPVKVVLPVQVTSRASVSDRIFEPFDPGIFTLSFTFDSRVTEQSDVPGFQLRLYGNPTFPDIPLDVPPLPPSARPGSPTQLYETTSRRRNGTYTHSAKVFATASQCCEGSALHIRQVELSQVIEGLSERPLLDPEQFARTLRTAGRQTGVGAAFSYIGHREELETRAFSGFIYTGFVVVESPAAVPEPDFMALLGAGLMFVVAGRFRRKSPPPTDANF